MTDEETYYYRRRFGEAYKEAFDCLKQLHANSEIPHFDDWSKISGLIDVMKALEPFIPMLEQFEKEGRLTPVWIHPRDDSLDLHACDCQTLLEAYRSVK